MILWQNEQWQVTDWGLECIGHDYDIPAVDLHSMDWLRHMSEKRWVDKAAFVEAYAEAKRRYPEHNRSNA